MAEETPVGADDEVEKTVAASIVRSKDYAVVYSNFVQCGFTAWDIRMNFGLVGVNEKGDANMTELVAVVLTPQLAKGLVGVLNNHVKAYEHDNGEILIPRSVAEEAKARRAKAEAEAQPAVKVE